MLPSTAKEMHGRLSYAFIKKWRQADDEPMRELENKMNHLTYHHYGATILDAPIAQLHGDMDAMLNLPMNLVPAGGHPITHMEELTDCAAGTHTLTYRSTTCMPEIAEYIATWTLARSADAPHSTMVEWTREYRPAAPINHDQIRTFVS